MIDRPSSMSLSAPAPVRRARRRRDWPTTRRGGAEGGRSARVHPIEHGVVTDAQRCAQLVGWTLAEAAVLSLPREILLAVPVAATRGDLRRAVSAVHAAADCPVRTVQAPLAAAIGAGRPVTDRCPHLVMDIGAGIVELAVIMRGRVSLARFVQYLPEHSPGHPGPRLPRYVCAQLAAELQQMLDDLPVRLRVQARAQGLALTGGGALLPSLPGWVTAQLAMTVHIAPDPAHATIRGLARICSAPAAVRTSLAPQVYELPAPVAGTDREKRRSSMPLDARDHLSSVQLQALREQLLGQLLRRSLELDQLLTTLRYRPGPAADRTTLYAQITRAEAHTSHLQQALERMRTGDYGHCRSCDGPIAFGLLKLRPLARQCLRCPQKEPAAGQAETTGRAPG
ncbi:rod shape-determining protein [Actinomadura rudentiformis]|nr:rod shape-determining protein [Actinomadura rudentiformis]